MADITLSSAVRNNLLSLQNTAELLGRTQERLATGLKVNSALDDPTAFFTASSLNARAGDLNRLLDSVGNALQTIVAADEGLSAITKLVETAQANVRQALQKPAAVATPAAAAQATGGVLFAADDTAAVATGTATLAADTAATTATSSGGAIQGADVLNSGDVGLAAGDSLTITSSDGSFTSTTINFVGTGASTSGTTLDVTVADIDNLVSSINAAAGQTIASVNGSNELQIQSINATADITIGGSIAGGNLTALASVEPANASAGLAAAVAGNETLQFTINGNTDTITFGTNDGANQVSNRAELEARLTAISGGGGNTGATFAVSSNNIVATAANVSDGAITISGGSNALSFAGFTGGQQAGTTNSALAGLTQTDFTVNFGGAGDETIDFSSINSVSDLDTALAGLTNGTGARTATGAIAFTGANLTDDIVIGGTVTGTGFSAGTTSATAASTTNNADRAALESEFNNLRTQLDELAADASFNGNNLLDGDNLTVIFNEEGTSTLSITGVTFDSAGLGISAAAADSFQSDANLNTILGELDTAIGSLRSQASTFGSNLSIVEIRQDFTKNLINTLETGAGNLTLADSNEEGANTLALQTRQQLSSVALSLASQADQNVLRLF